MRTISINPSTIKEAVNTLQKGGLVIAPTDTVYGALVDARNHEAVKKLIAFKSRPWGKPISIFVADLKTMNEYVYMRKKQKNMLKELLPGPFTVILDSKHTIDALLESEKGALGVRYINHVFIQALIKKYKHPLTATSANLSGRSAHYSVNSLLREFPRSKQTMIDLIVDGGELPRNKPSTVMDMTVPKIKVLRQGDVRLKEHKTFITRNPHETEKTAQFILKKYIQKKGKPLIFILQGPMGVGKTIFVKGVGRMFGVNDIISPTFVVSYEYPVNKQGIKKLVHCDFFNITEKEEFEHLGLKQYLVGGNIIFIEWGEKSGTFFDTLKEKGRVISIKMNYGKDTEREIIL